MSRTLATLRFFLASHGKADLPFAALLIPISLSGVLALIIRDHVTPFAFSLCALTLSAALVAIPLLGELGYLLRADPSSEWIEAQPIKPRELRAARTLHLLITLFGLKDAGKINGSVSLAEAIGGGMGIFLTGLVHDKFGGYNASWNTVMLVMVTGVVLIFLLKPTTADAPLKTSAS